MSRLNLLPFVLFLLISCCKLNAQDNTSPFNSPEETKLFADYLFCEKDFLRAADEYQRLLNNNFNDTILFKQGISLSLSGDYNKASDKFLALEKTSLYYNASREELARINFINENFTFRQTVETSPIRKLKAFSSLLINENLPSSELLSAPFENTDKRRFLEFYNKKKEMHSKSPVFAGALSFIVPGLGKIYSGNISDGLTSFVVTSLFGFLAYDNFKADHRFRGWLFSGLTLFFHAGNIYGSAAEAQLYNERTKQNFDTEVNEFVKSKNYFMQDYEFCK